MIFVSKEKEEAKGCAVDKLKRISWSDDVGGAIIVSRDSMLHQDEKGKT